MPSGFRDKVVILGMGCSKFGERWDCDPEGLMVEAYAECLTDAGIESGQIEAAWLATYLDHVHVGKSAIPISMALRLDNIPTTRVENMCASGTEALRGAAYAVAAGACDIALALGVEKLKDIGYGGLPQHNRGVLNSLWWANFSAPGSFAQLASAYRAKNSVERDLLKRAIAHVSVKSHRNGALNPKAHLQKAVSEEIVLQAPMVAEPLGIYDCCGVSDGAACAIVTTPEIARSLGKRDLVAIKAMQIATSNGVEAGHESWDGSCLPTTRIASKRAYEEAGVTDPRHDIDLIEVHDCFSITELVTMEDLHLSDDGAAITDVLDGRYDADGRQPCQIDGGLKCFGHPIGASGLRMAYEVYLQLLGRAAKRQLDRPSVGLTHNLGGAPHCNVSSVAIFGLI